MMIIHHFLFSFSGFSGTGKDECAKFLVNKYGALHSGLVDPAKRHMADIYGFSENQLFGSSEFRNNGDSRYPKLVYFRFNAKSCDFDTGILSNYNEYCYFDLTFEQFKQYMEDELTHSDCEYTDKLISVNQTYRQKRFFVKKTDPYFFLSPREALQKYCALMDEMYQYTWIQNAIELHQKMADVTDINSIDPGKWVQRSSYSRMSGFKYHESPIREKFHIINHGVPAYLSCLSDIRYLKQIEYLKKSKNMKMTPILIRVKRPGIETPPYQHKSETEQAIIPDSDFDFIINNDSNIQALHSKIDQIMKKVMDPYSDSGQPFRLI